MEPRRHVCRRLHEGYVIAQTAREESRGAFVASAMEARQEVARSGRVMAAADVHKWLIARAGGGKPARPRTRKLLK